ncbi:ribonuclease III domain-containing protein [Saccharibacillus sp. CPCC 101409]|uniref:Mini-ribonuclease 3 n=1 Tax=Saccharibacillus sp. CPCC 101409 TaxID=3058041 RepID=UPI0026721DB5|nr:ribonuclease III domain-containing protein [Saccharibacillus sp. CPCC 101409]MDO3412987.1 ribonuclease III domain-containing protein [Saccharibacillus sp. CPCC 101409]
MTGHENKNAPGEERLLFDFPPSKPAGQLPPIALAYLGDAVFELAIRQYLITGANLRPHYLHREATKLVSAGAQARLLFRLEGVLTEEEADIVRRGRNAKSGTMPKNANVIDYRHATALECLAGYLYYKGEHGRLEELIRIGLSAGKDAAAEAREPERD